MYECTNFSSDFCAFFCFVQADVVVFFSGLLDGSQGSPLHSGTPIKSACATICTSWSRTPSQTTNSRKRSCSGTVSAPYKRFYTPLHKKIHRLQVRACSRCFVCLRTFIQEPPPLIFCPAFRKSSLHRSGEPYRAWGVMGGEPAPMLKPALDRL